MAIPGWYPDPAGRPGAFRYWDGGAWSADLADSPYAPAPGGPPPPPPTPPGASRPAQVGFESYAAEHQPRPAPSFAPVGPDGAPNSAPNSAPSSAPNSAPSSPPGSPSWDQGPAAAPSRSVPALLVVVIAVLATAALWIATFLLVEAVTDDSGSSATAQPSGSLVATGDRVARG